MASHRVAAARDVRQYQVVVQTERFFGGHETMFHITPRTLANRRGLSTA